MYNIKIRIQMCVREVGGEEGLDRAGRKTRGERGQYGLDTCAKLCKNKFH